LTPAEAAGSIGRTVLTCLETSETAAVDEMQPTDFDNRTPAQRLARSQYDKGMNDLGRSLVALALLQTLVGIIALLVAAQAGLAVVILAVVVLVMGGVNYVLGKFALAGHMWVNCVVAVLSALLLCLQIVGLGLQGAQEQSGNVGSCIGFLIAAILLYYSVNNLRLYMKMNAGS